MLQLLRDDATEAIETKVLPITRVEDRHYQACRVYQNAHPLLRVRQEPFG